MAVLDRRELEESPLSDLHAIASELGIEGYRRLRREELIDALLAGGGGPAEEAEEAEPEEELRPRRRRGRRGGRGRRRDADPGDDEDLRDEDEAEVEAELEEDAEQAIEAEEEGEVRAGVLDVLPNGSGFMRPEPFQHSREDVYVSPAQIRRCELRAGDAIEGPVRPPRRNERHPSLVRVEKVNGGDAEPPSERPRFEDLTPVFAGKKLPAPEGLEPVPFGRGSRVAVGGPPGSGITTLLRRIVQTLASGGEDLDVVVVLAGARPEEVTEWRRDSTVTVAGGGFDRPVDEQVQAAEMAVERGKRAVESGAHAAIVIDSLDALPPSVARRVFGAARATEEGGTLTIIASTGLAGEPMRLATSRIVLEAGGAGPEGPVRLAPGSGTLRGEQLS
jgi:transcription termination factor Rho